MQVGFKTGPANWPEGQKIVLEDKATLCEVWFRIDKAGDYDHMLAWLKAKGVDVGLHHWGLIDGQYKTNIATQDTSIREQTIQQIKDTIDVGARIECVYVNAHCGAQALEKISFTDRTQEMVTENMTEKAQAEKIFLESAQELFEYARGRGVLLTIETLPLLEKRLEDNRIDAYNPGNIHYETLLKLSQVGGSIANDITHTAEQIFAGEQDVDAIYGLLKDFTAKAAPLTRVLHVNTVSKPFNGTDSHDGLLPEELAAGVFPNEKQVVELLSLFAARQDVFVIPEPHSHMRENYQALKGLVAQAQS